MDSRLRAAVFRSAWARVGPLAGLRTLRARSGGFGRALAGSGALWRLRGRAPAISRAPWRLHARPGGFTRALAASRAPWRLHARLGGFTARPGGLAYALAASRSHPR